MAKMYRNEMFGSKDRVPFMLGLSDEAQQVLFQEAIRKYGEGFDYNMLFFDQELLTLYVRLAIQAHEIDLSSDDQYKTDAKGNSVLDADPEHPDLTVDQSNFISEILDEGKSNLLSKILNENNKSKLEPNLAYEILEYTGDENDSDGKGDKHRLN